MPEALPASRQELETLLALRAVQLRMRKIAYTRTRQIADAEDLASQVRVLLLEGGSPWTPARDRPLEEQVDAFLVHTALLMRRIHLDRMRSREVRLTKELPETFGDTAADGQSNVEQRAVDLEWEQQHERRAHAMIPALRARMAGDRDALKVIDQHVAGVDDPREQADALGWDLPRVTLAHRRIHYHAPIVLAEQVKAEREAEEQRIAAAKAADAGRESEKKGKAGKGRVQP
jgi:hypothetical protein